MRLAPSTIHCFCIANLSYRPFTAQYPSHFFEISASAWAGHYLLLMTMLIPLDFNFWKLAKPSPDGMFPRFSSPALFLKAFSCAPRPRVMGEGYPFFILLLI